MMKKSVIGKNRITVSALGMGCWAYGGGKYWGEQPQEDVNRVVHAALDSGLNYFDTAEVYNGGESERSLGAALQGKRGKAVIGTKISPVNAYAEKMALHCDNSLSRLKTDYIDVYMLHWPVNYKSFLHFTSDGETVNELPSMAEVFHGMQKLQSQGKIREIGVSNHGVGQMREISAAGIKIAVNELPYNLVSRAIEKEILPYCHENGIAVIGYMAYQQGVLTGFYDNFESLGKAQAHSRHFHFSRGGEESRHGEEGAEKEIALLLSAVRRVSEGLGVPFATVSLAWAMSNEMIANTLVGSRNTGELEMNIKASGYKLPADALRELDKYSKPVWDALGDNPDYYEHRSESRIK